MYSCIILQLQRSKYKDGPVLMIIDGKFSCASSASSGSICKGLIHAHHTTKTLLSEGHSCINSCINTKERMPLRSPGWTQTDARSMAITSSEHDTIILAIRIIAPVSFLASLTLILMFLGITGLRNVQNRAVYNANWANLFAAAIWFLAPFGPVSGGESIVCKGLATGMLYFGLADAFWVFSMALNVYFVAIKHWALDELMKVLKLYHILAWGTPALLILPLPFITTADRGPVLGDRYTWCSIRQEYPELFMAVFYIPGWIVYLAGVACYLVIVTVIIRVRRTSRVSDTDPAATAKLNAFLFVTSLYLIHYGFVWIWPTVNRFLQAVNPNDQVFFLILMNGAAPAMRGIIYLAIFCYANRATIASALRPDPTTKKSGRNVVNMSSKSHLSPARDERASLSTQQYDSVRIELDGSTPGSPLWRELPRPTRFAPLEPEGRLDNVGAGRAGYISHPLSSSNLSSHSTVPEQQHRESVFYDRSHWSRVSSQGN
ncbi:hypothetical protein BJ742DRAFT_785595 [Cladochytrium replicatum]|nr:hypothetical protein BJ742DRAFT_785595 [Cladochytrium replicatum]